MTNINNNEIIDKILLHEHQSVAHRLGLIEDISQEIDDDLLNNTITVINDLLVSPNDKTKKIIVTLSSILWTYQKKHWEGLNDFLIRVLSQIGYAPSSIMIDTEYDHENKCYSGVNSLLDQLSITINQLQCEVLVGDQIFLLTQFQKNIWSQIELNKTLGISAPTSAGKSFIIALKAIDLILKEEGCIVYIVPTLSLVSQVSIDFRKLLNTFNLNDYEILNTFNGERLDQDKKIFVLTQEKAIGAFSQKNIPFKNIRLLIVDEIQNIERASNENEERAKTLYDLLIEFKHTPSIDRIVISGPRINNIGNLCHSLFGEGAAEENESSSPVASFTYSVEKNKKKYLFKQHNDIKMQPTGIEFKPPYPFPKPDGKLYNDKYYNFLHKFISYL